MKRRDVMRAIPAMGAGLLCPGWGRAAPARLTRDRAPASRAIDLAQARALKARWSGRPFVLHAWGLHCPACLRGLPSWRETLAATPGLTLLLVQVDVVPDAVEATDERLREAGLRAHESWTAIEELDEFTRHALDPQWLGETPFTLLSAPCGRLERLRGPVSSEWVQAWWRRR